MQQQKHDVFAFGTDSLDSAPCPAVAAGFHPESSDKSISVAEQFDVVVRTRYDLSEGTLPRSIAESCWNQAVTSTRREAERYAETDPEHSEHLHEAADVGEEIRDEVF